MKAELIAPCGMNCRLCWGYIREKNRCPGCMVRADKETPKSGYRTKCTIRDCEHLARTGERYCSEGCERFPCTRLKQLDKRYRSKYAMSMIENLKAIRESGIRQFLRNEKEKWSCPECGEVICVHRPICLNCGYNWSS